MIDNPFIKTVTVILLIVSLLAGSCGPKTRTITPLSEADRTRIKNVAIHVQVDEELRASTSNMKAWILGVGLATALEPLGSSWFTFWCVDAASCVLVIATVIIIASVTAAVRSNMDQVRENEFNEDVADINLEKTMAEHIDEYFESTDASFEAEISEIQSPSILAQQGFDTVLDIAIDNIEVKRCPKRIVYGYNGESAGGGGVVTGEEKRYTWHYVLSSDDAEYYEAITRWNEVYGQYAYSRIGPTAVNEFLFSSATAISKKEAELVKELEILKPIIEKYVQNSVRMLITFKGKMISTSDNRVIWDREELYYDPKCEYVEEIQNNPEIAVDMITRSIHDIAVNTVNEIQ